MCRSGRVLVAVGLLLSGSRAGADNHLDFDNPGSPHRFCGHQAGPGAEVLRDPLATDYSGRYVRLAHAAVPSQNSLVFEVDHPVLGARTLDLDFDFRIVQQGGRGDGVGVALLRRNRFLGRCVELEGPFNVAEEPNFAGSIGFGFDVRQDAPRDNNNNHVSVHWDGAEIAEISTGSLDLARGNWIHASIRIREDGADGRLTLVLKPKGGAPPRVVFNELLLPGFQVYPARLWVGARAAAGEAIHDVDNVHLVTTGLPAQHGQWALADITFPMPEERALPIHAHLLPNGKVLFWDRHDYDPPGDHMPRLWDPATGSLTMMPEAGYDVFCSGHAFRADGKLFVAGGHIEDHDGEPHASSFDPETNTWEMHPPMNEGRWYPTVTTLADGKLLVVAGSFFDQNGNTIQNDLPQVFDPATNGWRDLTTARLVDSYYPFMYQAPNGRVFDAGPRPQTRYLDVNGTGAWTAVASSSYGQRNYGSSAMDVPGRIMILGGSPSDFSQPPTNSVELIDLKETVPAWRQATRMAWARRQHTTTLLPDGTALVVGGSAARGHSNWMGAVYHPELWDPKTETWRTLARMQEARLYHSTALLLPDGRILVAGGGHPRDEENAEPDHFQAEMYSPPYLFAGPRPEITSAPTDLIAYGSEFEVGVADPSVITSVSLIRLGSVTHGFDMNQRYVPLTFTAQADRLRVQAPAAGTVAPPGHYMLFVLRAGVPSVARIVRIGTPAPLQARPALGGRGAAARRR